MHGSVPWARDSAFPKQHLDRFIRSAVFTVVTNGQMRRAWNVKACAGIGRVVTGRGKYLNFNVTFSRPGNWKVL